MEPYDARQLAFIEVTANSITNICFKSGEIVSLCEDRLAQCSGCVATFGSSPDLTPPGGAALKPHERRERASELLDHVRSGHERRGVN
jgi:hypothetical protein